MHTPQNPTKNAAAQSRREDRNHLFYYFYKERSALAVIALTGILYNIGMTAGPWFEGQLAGCLCDIIGGNRTASDMLSLALCYVAVILFVQVMRYFKRLYVRKFANQISRSMKETLYRNLIHKSKKDLEEEGAGALMTKIIADADACAEGMRKFTTEVFDTGVVMAAYLTLLFLYDWRLTLICIVFPPIAYFLAARLKVLVTKTSAAGKESAGRLNDATLDSISNALTYRVYGQESNHGKIYEEFLQDYEQKAIRANLWENVMQPVYQMIAMAGTIFILWLGGRNVLGTGWTMWDIAAFSTFLSCFLKLAVKSSKAAKLFNAVQKASVSWKRIQPFLKNPPEEIKAVNESPAELTVSDLSFHYPGEANLFEHVTFHAVPGQIFGITGEVACGKSTLGKVFLCESPYSGSIQFGGRELSELMDAKDHRFHCITGYLGHQPELFCDTIEENIRLGKAGDLDPILSAVCMKEEIASFPDGLQTVIGSSGVRLSGGQQARVALARTLFHPMPLLILDDPFSAVDLKTEQELFQNLRARTADSVVLLISHRLTLFDQMDGVLWLEHGHAFASSHKELFQNHPTYRTLYELQTGARKEEHDEK